MNFFLKNLSDIVAIILLMTGLSMALGPHPHYWLLISASIGYGLSFIPVVIERIRIKHESGRK